MHGGDSLLVIVDLVCITNSVLEVDTPGSREPVVLKHKVKILQEAQNKKKSTIFIQNTSIQLDTEPNFKMQELNIEII